MYEAFSRRTYNCRCRFWKVKSDNREWQNLVHKQKANGVFFAKESQETRKDEIEEAGIVEVDYQYATIESTDDLSELEHKDIVEYLGQLWIVENIQFKIVNKTTEYYTRPIKVWWVNLRNGK